MAARQFFPFTRGREGLCGRGVDATTPIPRHLQGRRPVSVPAGAECLPPIAQKQDQPHRVRHSRATCPVRHFPRGRHAMLAILVLELKRFTQRQARIPSPPLFASFGELYQGIFWRRLLWTCFQQTPAFRGHAEQQQFGIRHCAKAPAKVFGGWFVDRNSYSSDSARTGSGRHSPSPPIDQWILAATILVF
jgi:hypothetical protein